VTSEIAAALEDAIERLGPLELGDAFEPQAAAAIVGAGLHRLCVPTDAGGLGASMREAAEVLMALGAVDGSTALGFAMQVHVTGAMREADQFARDMRERLYRAIVDDGALLNNAATEEGGGSPARGAIPGTQAEEAGDGTWRLTGEKTWTTWLPNLTHVFVTARYGVDDEVGRFLVELDSPGVRRLPGFYALGMRGSA
jgi:alkylation response protein AidB-like acyl-CoA dehydrogenase